MVSAINQRLVRQIDKALNADGVAGFCPDFRAPLSSLFAMVAEYLSLPIPLEVRTAALEVARISGNGLPDLETEARFRATLESLRDALESQKEQDEAAGQFAEDPDMVREFLAEGRAHLSDIEAGILTLEREPGNAEALNAVFRSFHTIKGIAGFLGALAIQELAHETENVLDLARAGKLHVSAEVIDLILKSADELTSCIDKADHQKVNHLPRCNASLLDSLSRLAHGAHMAPLGAGDSDDRVSMGSVAVPHPESSRPARERKAGPEIEQAGATARQGEVAVATRNWAENSVVRIETAKLEYLIDMVGELAIAESVVRNDPSITGSEDPLLTRKLAQLSRVVREVRKASMSMGMVAIGTVFRRMSRLTRDLARRSAKTIELITIGDKIELDRSIAEELADPMVHMVRNAVDHGLETPAERLAAGKPETGIVRLQAMHDGADIVIEINDDGRGMDPARLLAKARKCGLVGEQETPDEDAIFKLIFEPGFSTAEKVTDISGRGVGMDVVKEKIEKLRGQIAIRSEIGKGSTFVLRLPITLAIIEGIVVGAGEQRFILPMSAVRQTFSPKPETFVTLENRAQAAFFRDKLLPVIRLSRLFESRTEDRSGGLLIVVEGRDQFCCIAVDQLIGKQEVMIKSLGKTFRDVPGISGGAILRDGRVGLIIDVNSLLHRNSTISND